MSTATVPIRTSGPVAQALRDATPLALPIIPFAMAIGTATAEAGIPLAAGWLGAVMLFAGSAQLALTETLGGGGSLIAAAGVAVLVAARFALYSAALASWFAGGSRRRNLLLVFALFDQQFLLCEHRFTDEHDDRWRVRYYLAVTAIIAVPFLAALPVGYLLGGAVPDGVGLRLAGPIVFAGMLGSAVTDRSDVVAALAAAVAVVVVSPVLAGAAVPVAAVAGIAVGARLLDVQR
ncbi:MAG: AzlC family ABC transporter permease [Actinomycetota bacterium]